MENNVVSVILWGSEVGKLYWDTKTRRAIFSYNPAFIKKGMRQVTRIFLKYAGN